MKSHYALPSPMAAQQWVVKTACLVQAPHPPVVSLIPLSIVDTEVRAQMCSLFCATHSADDAVPAFVADAVFAAPCDANFPFSCT